MMDPDNFIDAKRRELENEKWRSWFTGFFVILGYTIGLPVLLGILALIARSALSHITLHIH
jgi:hypothetical protein